MESCTSAEKTVRRRLVSRGGRDKSIMTSLTAEHNHRIANLIASRRDGFSLPGSFYSNELVYRAELERIWRGSWLFAGHTCEIANPGDYFTFSVGDDSLIIIRNDDDEINALWNVCRH